jgi:hypothetical protein
MTESVQSFRHGVSAFARWHGPESSTGVVGATAGTSTPVEDSGRATQAAIPPRPSVLGPWPSAFGHCQQAPE